MVGLLQFLFKLVLLALLYLAAFYYFVPSDVVQAGWLKNPGLILVFARIFGLLLLYRFVKTLFFSGGKPAILRLLSAVFALPFYALISALIVISLNGYLDRQMVTTSWVTNIAYVKDLKLVCMAAAIDDAQIRRGESTPQWVLIPGHFCSALSADDISPQTLMPYNIIFSAGQFSIPYVSKLEKL